MYVSACMSTCVCIHVNELSMCRFRSEVSSRQTYKLNKKNGEGRISEKRYELGYVRIMPTPGQQSQPFTS